MNLPYDYKWGWFSSPILISCGAVPMEGRSPRRERPAATGQGTQVGRTPPPAQPQDLGGAADTENSEEIPRYDCDDEQTAIKNMMLLCCCWSDLFLCCRFTELIDRRGKITAKLTHLPRKAIRHRNSKYESWVTAFLSHFPKHLMCSIQLFTLIWPK